MASGGKLDPSKEIFRKEKFSNTALFPLFFKDFMRQLWLVEQLSRLRFTIENADFLHHKRM